MIEKISISNVASYKDITTLETDKKTNLIYGLNGTGKSTISNYLYNNDDIKYTKCSISGLNGANVLVYNSQFVRDNFYETDKINGIFTLSKENKTAEVELEQLKSQKQEKLTLKDLIESNINANTKQLDQIKKSAEEKTWNIKSMFSGGDRTLEFCLDGLKGNKEKLFEHISNIEKPKNAPTKNTNILKKEVDAIQGSDAKKHIPLPTIKININPIELDPIFKRSIIGNQNSSVAGLIEKLESADWVKEGITYLELLSSESNNSCPFCQEKTINSTVTTAIKNYFDESYSKAITTIQNLHFNYSTETNLIPVNSTYTDNPLLAPKIDEFNALYDNLTNTTKSNIELIFKKLKNPSQEITLKNSKEITNRINLLIEETNLSISEHNQKIDNKAQTLNEIKTEFWNIMRWDYAPDIDTYKQQKNTHDQKNKDKQEELTKTNEHLHSITLNMSNTQRKTVNIDAAIEKINTDLSNLGINSFKITKHQDTLYQIARDGEPVSDFKTLSEGEKTVISFLYFVELCKGKKSAADTSSRKIIVIDDPISSLSHIYIFNIGQMIKKEFINSASFEQVFILTHSLYFFYEITEINKDKRHATQKLFRLIKNSTGSKITAMKYEEIQNDYQSYWSIIKDSAQPPALIANCMRNIVEYFFNFIEMRDLNNVFQKPELQDNKYQAFYRFMNRESHSLSQNIFDYKEFDYTIFKDAFELLFEASGFHAHYKTMMR